MTPDRPLYETVAELCCQWGKPHIGTYGYSSVGMVVGATQPREMTALRRDYPEAFFLVPGYGAQGGGAVDCALAFDKLGRGAIVNSSRAILCAWKKKNDPDNFAHRAREEVQRMASELAIYIQCM